MSDTSTSEKQGSQAVLLEVSDLPRGSTEAEESLVSKRCDPRNYFRSYAISTASPFGFFASDTEVLQTVGVFENPKLARKAFVAVSSDAARECVGGEMQRSMRNLTNLSGALQAENVPTPLPGKTTKTMRLTVTTRYATAEVQRTAILGERILTTVTYIAQNRPLDLDLRDSITRKAANRLDEVAASLEG